MRKHDHILDYVDDYLHDVLSAREAEQVERHCQSCRICQVALDEARKRQSALEAMPVHEASDGLVRATMEKVERHEKRLRPIRKLLRWGAVAAAACILLLAGVHLWFWNLSPTPYDLQVLGQNTLLAGSNASLRVRLLNSSTGAPMAAIPVLIELRGKESNRIAKLAEFQTDAQGTGRPRFKLPDWEEGDYQLRVSAKPASGIEVVTQTIKLERSWKVMLSSDKPVYQPGQEIRLRSLALRRPDLKPVAGQAVTFAVTDPKGNVIFKRQDVTSKFGIASADCALASELIEGAYAIDCKVGDTASKLTVEVKKYVLPKFQIEIEDLKPYYQPGQTVEGTVRARYFFGKPVVDGEVRLEATTVGIAATGVAEKSLRTDAEGRAKFEFRLPERVFGREQEGGDARIALKATVSDTARQKEAKSISRVVTANPVKIEVIPEAGRLVPDVPNRIYLYVSRADGLPLAKARVLVATIKEELVTNTLGVASFDLPPISIAPGEKSLEVPAATQLLVIRAEDQDGNVCRQELILAYGQVSPDFFVRTDKAVYDGGETMTLTALGGGVEPVFVDLIKDGQTMLTAAIDLDRGQGKHEVDLPPELFGTVQLVAYRYGPDGLPVRKARVLYVRQAKEIKIVAGLEKEYKPGEKARLRFSLTDPSGQPAPGALSLSAVDEAVFAVLEQMPGMERTFYLLEQKLLEPVYAIYGWSPDVDGTIPPPERNQFEQALFARTAQELPAPATGRRPRGGDENAVHSLAAESLPIKTAETYHIRTVGLRWLAFIWGGLLLTLLCGTLGSLCWVNRDEIRSKVSDLLTACNEYPNSDQGSPRIGWLGGTLMVGFLLLVAIASITALGSNASGTFDYVSTRVASVPGGGPFWGDKASAKDGAPKFFDLRPLLEEPPATPEKSEPKNSVTAPPPRVRDWFPETLFWKPEVITDDQGKATVEITLADSITEWRLLASAVTADGRLGAARETLRVFQPFFVDLNLPVALTRGDEAAIPVVVHNHLDRPQTVELTLSEARWFERLDEPRQSLSLKAGEVRSVSYRLRVKQVGLHTMQVEAKGDGVSDAIKKEIEVAPDGRRVEQLAGGTLHQPLAATFTVPQSAIEGSPKLIVKIYPSTFSQLVEGLDSIFQMPYGCFEQTSSVTYPNILALDYLRRTKKSVPEVEAKARQYIHLGYQRLLTFEVQGGGFEWFGHPPALLTMTAYGLMEFQDMARVHDVDPKLIERTRTWLLDRRNADGSWSPESRRLFRLGDPTRGAQGSDLASLSTTAFIAWPVFSDPSTRGSAQKTRAYLLSHTPASIGDPYVLGLVCNALLAIDPAGQDARPYLERLDSLKQTSTDGKQSWWVQAAEANTLFYGNGRAGEVEVTALATLAFIQSKHNPAAVRGALAWLIGQKDAQGTWHSTQATVLALKALVAGTGVPGEKERRFELALGDGYKRKLTVPANQAEVMQQLDLTKHLRPGENRFSLREETETAAGYQAAFVYHVPEAPAKPQGPLGIDVNYDRTELAVNDTLRATATVTNRMPQTAPMVMLDLPIPAGFGIMSEDFQKLVDDGTIARFQVTRRQVIVYLRGLEPGQSLKLTYRLRATMPVQITVPAARVWEYYNPDRQATSAATALKVTARTGREG